MNKIDRRSFLGKASLSLAALGFLSSSDMFAAATASDVTLGFQTFPIRDILSKDFVGTLKMMTDMGYKLVEMCFPKTYAQIGFGPLAEWKTSDL